MRRAKTSAKKSPRETAKKWAAFRLSVIGSLLADPPGPGQLKETLADLSEREWITPNGKPQKFAFRTLEDWFLTARDEDDPLKALRKRPRDDRGSFKAINSSLEQAIKDLYSKSPDFTYVLYHQNIKVLCEEDPKLFGKPPSLNTITRFMKANHLKRIIRPKKKSFPFNTSPLLLAKKEISSFQREKINELWHVDYTKCPFKIDSGDKIFKTPSAFIVLDDRSRMVLYIEWFFEESAESLCTGFHRAALKRGLCAEVLLDNSDPMNSWEFFRGCTNLKIQVHHTSMFIPLSNGKLERFNRVLKQDLCRMAAPVIEMDLVTLNKITRAWIDEGYNKRLHSAIKETPFDCYKNGIDVARPTPDDLIFKRAFRDDDVLPINKDGCVKVGGMIFAVPRKYWREKEIIVRFAPWNLDCVHIMDDKTHLPLEKIYPKDTDPKKQNQQHDVLKNHQPINSPKEAAIVAKLSPYLRRLVERYNAETQLPSVVEAAVNVPPIDRRSTNDANPTHERRADERLQRPDRTLARQTGGKESPPQTTHA